MNSNVVKVKKVLEAFLESAEKDDAEKIKITKMYNGDYAANMLKEIKARFYQEYISSQKQIREICAKAIEDVVAKDILCGADITQDAKLIADDSPFTLTKEQFESLILKYAGKNNTMCVLLRQYYEKNRSRYLAINEVMHAGIANREERIDAWKGIENGALGILTDVFDEYYNTDERHIEATKRHRLWPAKLAVKDFMSTEISRRLINLVEY